MERNKLRTFTIRGLSLCLTLSLLIGLAACGTGETPTPPPTEPVIAPTEELPPPPESTPPGETPEPEPEYAVIPNMNSLYGFLNDQISQDNREITFQYGGNSSRITPQTLAELVATLYVKVERDPSNRRLFHTTVIPFPGDRIAAAYKSGDTSGLSEEEQQVLELAKQMVEQAQAEASDRLTLERKLHDLLVDHITYHEGLTEVSDPDNPPRYMTVVGALMDGIADSRGYSDAFYTLASMAGFEVGRMHVLKVTDLRMVNIIKLDGAWYTVDVAYNDNDQVTSGYQIFNFGRNMDLVYDWGVELEYHPLANVRYDYKDFYGTEIPKIASLNELREYFNDLIEQDIFDMLFEYTGKASDLEDFDIADLTDSSYGTLTEDRNNPGTYCLTILEQVGYRIVDAYFSGDSSKLSPSEKEALDIAIEMVNEAKSIAQSDLELELLLHDMMVANMEYDSSFSNDVVDIRNPHRHLTAVGALVDGKANCQGYADGFYVLCTMAGFEVGKIIVNTTDVPDHIVNIINLDGKWYVVDATFNDTSGDVHPHFLFNAGKDMCVNYSWNTLREDHPLTTVSDHNYYYYMEENSTAGTYQKSFQSIDEMAENILREWKEEGHTTQFLFLPNQVSRREDLTKKLSTMILEQGLRCKLSVQFMTNGRDSFFRVDIEHRD